MQIFFASLHPISGREGELINASFSAPIGPEKGMQLMFAIEF
jgi:hypothetical protein